MSKRSAARNRRRQAAKALPARVSAGAISLTPAQLAAFTAAQVQLAQGNMHAAPLPSSPFWDTSPFGPGRRLPPAPINVTRPDSQRAEPRLWEYPVSFNLQIGDRPHVPWKTLQDAANMPLFRKCIKRRKGVCGLGYTVTLDPEAVGREAAASGQADKDVEKAMRARYMPDIIRISDWLATPDRGNGWDWQQWTSLLMENRLKFDATVVYPRYTYGGDVYSFEVIDGKLIKPLWNEFGSRPLPPYPAYQQLMYGFPRGEFTADMDPGETDPQTGRPVVPGGYPSDVLLYERTELRSESPYGMPDTEIALLDGLLWMRRMGWLLAEYTEGVAGAMLETGPETDWTVQQWEDWLRALNDHLGGNTAERMKWQLMPPGVKAVLPPEVAERYKPDMDMFLIKLIAGDFGLTATELGFPEVGSLGASFHEGEEDVLNRVTRRPDANWIAGIATKLAIRHLGMPPVLQVQVLGLESEDEAAADAIALQQVQSGRMTLNQDNERRGMPPYDFSEADMPMLMTARGVVFLEGASTASPPGTLVTPAMAPPTSTPPGGDAGAPEPGQDGEDGHEPPVTKAAETRALKTWAARHPAPGRQFVCKVLTAADVPALAGDPRVVFKEAGGPKVLAGTGPAGSGTGSW